MTYVINVPKRTIDTSLAKPFAELDGAPLKPRVPHEKKSIAVRPRGPIDAYSNHDPDFDEADLDPRDGLARRFVLSEMAHCFLPNVTNASDDTHVQKASATLKKRLENGEFAADFFHSILPAWDSVDSEILNPRGDLIPKPPAVEELKKSCSLKRRKTKKKQA